MAVDSRDKRASVLNLTIQNIGHIWPNPSGSLNQAARQQIAFVYRGILAVTPAVVAWFNGLTTNKLLTGVGQ